MRILLDGCIWWKVSEDLRQAGHDVEWVGDWPSDPGDPAIMAHAFRERRILVTLASLRRQSLHVRAAP